MGWSGVLRRFWDGFGWVLELVLYGLGVFLGWLGMVWNGLDGFGKATNAPNNKAPGAPKAKHAPKTEAPKAR